LLEARADIDVSDEATRVQADTLVLHARDELRVPFEQARRLATLIPGARLVPLGRRNQSLLRADEPAWQRFLEEGKGPNEGTAAPDAKKPHSERGSEQGVCESG
jgi:hypothetical protein